MANQKAALSASWRTSRPACRSNDTWYSRTAGRPGPDSSRHCTQQGHESGRQCKHGKLQCYWLLAPLARHGSCEGECPAVTTQLALQLAPYRRAQRAPWLQRGTSVRPSAGAALTRSAWLMPTSKWPGSTLSRNQSKTATCSGGLLIAACACAWRTCNHTAAGAKPKDRPSTRTTCWCHFQCRKKGSK